MEANFFPHHDPRHRRATSDSFVFLEESGFQRDCCAIPCSTGPGSGEDADIVNLRYDNLISMYWDVDCMGELMAASAISVNSETTGANEVDLNWHYNHDQDLSTKICEGDDEETKRIKRIMANRKSAHRSRIRRLQYIADLERNVDGLHNRLVGLEERIQESNAKKMEIEIENLKLKDELSKNVSDLEYHETLISSLKEKIAHLRHKRAGLPASDSMPPLCDDWMLDTSVDYTWSFHDVPSPVHKIADV